MAFIKISNGIDTIDVQKSAYEEMYKQLGFKPVGKVKSEKVSVEEEILEDSAEVEAEYDSDIETDFISELLEKPLSKWTKEETIAFADEKGIDISGKKGNEAKELIKAYLDNEARESVE